MDCEYSHITYDYIRFIDKCRLSECKNDHVENNTKNKYQNKESGFGRLGLEFLFKKKWQNY